MTRKALFLAAFSAALLMQVPAQAESRGPVSRIFLDQLKGLDDAGRKTAASCEDLLKCAGLMTPAQ